MTGSKKSDDFGKNIDDRVAILWDRLKQFVENPERVAFVGAMFALAQKELKLLGQDTPEPEDVIDKTNEYFVRFIPQIYNGIMRHRHSNAQFKTFEESGPIEVFEEGAYHFYSLGMAIKKIEKIVLGKYAHDQQT